MSNDHPTLAEVWRLRDSAAVTLSLAEGQMCRTVRAASLDELVALIETFAPGRSPGTDWTRTFEPLTERLWSWCDDATMEALAAAFRAKGMPWATVASAFSSENGDRIRAGLRQPAWARQPAFALA